MLEWTDFYTPEISKPIIIDFNTSIMVLRPIGG